MTLNNTVKEMLWYFPSIFKSKMDCLHHLFCVLGNGYHWKNGQLVDPDKPTDEDTFRGVNSIKKEIAKLKRRKTRKCILEIYEEQKKDYEDRISRNRDNIKTLVSQDGELSEPLYPLCDLCKICEIPDDIRPDWMNGAKALVKYLLDHEKYKDEHYKKDPETSEKVTKSNKEILDSFVLKYGI